MTVIGPQPGVALPTRRVLGYDLIDSPDLDRVVTALMAPQPSDDALPLVATPNVDDLVKLQRAEHAELAHLVRRARYLLPDGQPVVWASRLLGQPLSARLPGSDLLPRWWTALADQATPTVVVAPDQAVADRLADRHPRLDCVVAPRLDHQSLDAVRSFGDHVAVVSSELGARAVLIGIGFPHQQRLAARLLEVLPSPQPLIALLGGSFDLFTGRTRRAPLFMQRAGLEWAYRLSREPRRLARRYLIDDLMFVPMVWQAAHRARRHPGGTT